MDVLVTGGTGFVGRNLCAELVDRGHDVTALSRRPYEKDVPEGVETAVGNVENYDSIAADVAAADAVYNLVALSPLYKPEGGNERHFEVHLEGTKNVVRAAEAGDVDRYVQLSFLGARPDAKPTALRAKGEAEGVVQSSDLDWTIVRPSVIFGEGGEFIDFTKLLTTPYVTGLPGGGKTRFQPIWIEDFVAILADVIDSEDHVGKVYDVAGPEEFTLAEITELAYEAEGKPVTVLPVPMLLARIALRLVDPLPFIPFGLDQYHSLKEDNTTESNDLDAFGRDPSELRTLRDDLGLA